MIALKKHFDHSCCKITDYGICMLPYIFIIIKEAKQQAAPAGVSLLKVLLTSSNNSGADSQEMIFPG
jgi:hypothetical protein